MSEQVRVNVHYSFTLSRAAIEHMVGEPDDGSPEWVQSAREAVYDYVMDEAVNIVGSFSPTEIEVDL